MAGPLPTEGETETMPILEAPSGLTADVRKIKGTELIKLAEGADDSGPDGGFGNVLSGCWLRTTDAGPYAFVQVGDAKPQWSRLLKGDALYAFVFLRSISMPDGDDYDFPVQCEECKHRYDWTVKLSSLKVQKLSEEGAASVKSGKPLETHLPDGRAVRFMLQTIAQEEPLTKFMKQQKRETATMIDTLVSQIVSIEGVKPDIRNRWRFVSELDMDVLYNLRADFDSKDCGIETQFQTRCTKRSCRWEQDVNLPLGKTFFAPKRRRAEPIETTEEDLSDEPSTESWSEDSSDSTPKTAGDSSTTSSGSSTGEADTLSATET